MKTFLARFEAGCNLSSWGIGINIYPLMFQCIDISFGPFWASFYFGPTGDMP